MKSKDINFEYIEEFVDYILDKVVGNEDLFISVVAKFDDMREIVKSILLYEDVNFEKLELTTPLINEYEDEYVLELFWEDGVLEFNCMPLKVDGKYDYPTADEVFIFDDCKQKIVAMCDGSLVDIVHIYDEDDECDCAEDCGECCPCDCHCDDSRVEYSKTDDGEFHGFTASKSTDNGYHSYSFYTSDALSKSDIHDMLKEFGF